MCICGYFKMKPKDLSWSIHRLMIIKCHMSERCSSVERASIVVCRASCVVRCASCVRRRALSVSVSNVVFYDL